MKIHDLLQYEVDYVKQQGNLTERENQLFDLRNDEVPLEECAEIMNCSLSTVKRIHKSLKRKIVAVL